MGIFLEPFMIRALLAAAVTGLAAPAVGTYLVQRRLALLGDGIGHVCVTGVALGLLTGTSPTVTAILTAIEHGEPLPVTLPDACTTLELIAGIYASAFTGTRIRPGDIDNASPFYRSMAGSGAPGARQRRRHRLRLRPLRAPLNTGAASGAPPAG